MNKPRCIYVGNSIREHTDHLLDVYSGLLIGECLPVFDQRSRECQAAIVDNSVDYKALPGNIMVFYITEYGEGVEEAYPVINAKGVRARDFEELVRLYKDVYRDKDGIIVNIWVNNSYIHSLIIDNKIIKYCLTKKPVSPYYIAGVIASLNLKTGSIKEAFKEAVDHVIEAIEQDDPIARIRRLAYEMISYKNVFNAQLRLLRNHALLGEILVDGEIVLIEAPWPSKNVVMTEIRVRRGIPVSGSVEVIPLRSLSRELRELMVQKGAAIIRGLSSRYLEELRHIFKNIIILRDKLVLYGENVLKIVVSLEKLSRIRSST
ncbi:MAG: hypothetical protein J7K21_01745 [Desulfurococcales archaeon]|nr:hypothetical protein [Desulfurococcales archaeon]